MRVLVTGLSGFVGSALYPALVQRGHDVRSLPRRDWTAGQFDCGDAVVHLANVADPRMPRAVLWDVNVRGTQNAAEMAAEAGVRRFVYVSSVKAENTEDYYGSTKLQAECALADVSARTGMEVVVLRPPLLYGAGVRGGFRLLLQAITLGWPLPFAGIENRRSLLYVENLADAIVHCLENPRSAARTYALSDGAPVSTPALCQALGDALGRPAKLFHVPIALLNRFSRIRALVESLEIDDSALRTELAWQPPFLFIEGLRKTTAWYLRCRNQSIEGP